MDLSQFITEYFINPIEQPDVYAPYNPVNTIVFALVAIAACALIYKGVRKLGLDVDEQFAKAVMPYAALGAIARVLSDAGALPRKVLVGDVTLYPFITPGIYVVTFLLMATVFAVVFLTEKENNKRLTKLFTAGAVLCTLALLPLLPLFKNYSAIVLVLVFVALSFVCYRFAVERKWVLDNPFNKLVVLGQGLDGAATYTGVAFFGYAEQHIVANAVFDAATPLAFMALKTVFALAVCHYAAKEKDGSEKNYVLLLIAILGFAPGLRDLLRVVGGT